MSSCGPDRATLGTVPSGITSRTRPQPRRVVCKVPLGETALTNAPAGKPFLPHLASMRHSPHSLQANRTGGGRNNKPDIPGSWSAAHIRTHSRNVTHRKNRKRLPREEGTSTSTNKRTNHGHRPSPQTTTAPLPERHLKQPFRKTGRSAVHVTTRNTFPKRSERPIGIASRPSFLAVERSMLRSCRVNQSAT